MLSFYDVEKVNYTSSHCKVLEKKVTRSECMHSFVLPAELRPAAAGGEAAGNKDPPET